MVLGAQDVAAFGKKVERYLAKHGAHVAIVAGKGRPDDEIPRGINYTHTGFAVYSSITMEDGTKAPGYAFYNLYQKPERFGESELVVDYPYNFFSGSMELTAGIVVPSPKLQEKLLSVIRSDRYGKLHNPRYSAISNPFNKAYQNCTEYILDIINAAIYDTDDIDVLKHNAAAYFSPQTIHINPFKVILGGLVNREIATSDHRGTFATATFTTLRDYLDQYGLMDSSFILTTVN